MKNTTDIREQENQIMASANLTDMEKLQRVFQLRKAEIKEQFPQLFYCILGVLDSQKIGSKKKLPEADPNPSLLSALVSEVPKFGEAEMKITFNDGSVGYVMGDTLTRCTNKVGDKVVVQHIYGDYYRVNATESNRFKKE